MLWCKFANPTDPVARNIERPAEWILSERVSEARIGDATDARQGNEIGMRTS